MTERTSPDREGPASDIDLDASDPDQTTADSDQSEHLPATTSTRMRPSALDLERALD